MKMTHPSIFALIILLSLHLPSPPPLQGVIHVEIDGLRSAQGKVWCALYNSAKGFPKDASAAQARASSAASGKHGVCEFTDVKPGTYAVSVYHDENSNGKLDTNFLGIPKEGVGASNDAKGHMGPPKFSDAAFTFNGDRLELIIHVHYL
jgi:uncharacterized protein (DUF2141 family)